MQEKKFVLKDQAAHCFSLHLILIIIILIIIMIHNADACVMGVMKMGNIVPRVLQASRKTITPHRHP